MTVPDLAAELGMHGIEPERPADQVPGKPIRIAFVRDPDGSCGELVDGGALAPPQDPWPSA